MLERRGPHKGRYENYFEWFRDTFWGARCSEEYVQNEEHKKFIAPSVTTDTIPEVSAKGIGIVNPGEPWFARVVTLN